MTMAAPSRPSLRPGELGPEVRAARNGKCEYCGGRVIAFEDYIRKSYLGWLHSGCAREYVRGHEVFKELDGEADR